MDQFEHRVAIDHRALRGCDILAQLERLLVDLADHALVVDDVVVGVLQALDQAEAAAVDQPLLGGGIADQGIGRGQPVDDDVGYEIGPVALQLVELQLFQPVLHTFLNRKVILRTGAEERVVLPGRILEPLVLRVGGQLALAGQDLDHVLAKGLHVPGGTGRVAGGLAQQQRDRADEVLARQADQRAQRRGRLRRFILQRGPALAHAIFPVLVVCWQRTCPRWTGFSSRHRHGPVVRRKPRHLMVNLTLFQRLAG